MTGTLDERLIIVKSIVKHPSLTFEEKEKGIELIETFYDEHKNIHGSFYGVINYEERMQERYNYIRQKLYETLPALKNKGEN